MLENTDLTLGGSANLATQSTPIKGYVSGYDYCVSVDDCKGFTIGKSTEDYCLFFQNKMNMF
jgi:hypothetical protein